MGESATHRANILLRNDSDRLCLAAGPQSARTMPCKLLGRPFSMMTFRISNRTATLLLRVRKGLYCHAKHIAPRDCLTVRSFTPGQQQPTPSGPRWRSIYGVDSAAGVSGRSVIATGEVPREGYRSHAGRSAATRHVRHLPGYRLSSCVPLARSTRASSSSADRCLFLRICQVCKPGEPPKPVRCVGVVTLVGSAILSDPASTWRRFLSSALGSDGSRVYRASRNTGTSRIPKPSNHIGLLVAGFTFCTRLS